jgi:hypothetical protein
MLSIWLGVSVSAPLVSFSLDVFAAGGPCWAKPATLAPSRITATNANDLSRAIDNLIINPLVFLMLPDGQPQSSALDDELYQRSTVRLQSSQMSVMLPCE